MRMPETLSSLVDEGIIEEVLRPLMSGKEAQIYLVVADGKQCVAKIYKEAQNRTFKHRADYTEGRKVRNSRDQRAIDKRSKHGRGQDEAAWRSTEVDMIYRLQAAGVRVPAPYHFIDGVLVMELVTGADGEPAPRLGEVDFSPEEATLVHERLLREVVRMLCAGVVHGDLSDFNVLMGTDGPVIIDLPQAVDPSKNQNARKLLLRDVDNLQRFLSRFAPTARRAPYAEEMWALYESNQLTPATVLRGQYRPSQKKADTGALLELIGEVNEDERRRRAATQPQNGRHPRRVEISIEKSTVPNRRTSFNVKPLPAPTGAGAATSSPHARPLRQGPPAHSSAPSRLPRPSPPVAPRQQGAPPGRASQPPVRPSPSPARPPVPGRPPQPPAQRSALPHGPPAVAADGPASPEPGAAPARRRRRRRPRQSGVVPTPVNTHPIERLDRPEPARPHPSPAPSHPLAEAGQQGSSHRRRRHRPRNPQRPAGSS
jgi:RIO kinase 1